MIVSPSVYNGHLFIVFCMPAKVCCPKKISQTFGYGTNGRYSTIFFIVQSTKRRNNYTILLITNTKSNSKFQDIFSLL